MKTTIGNELPYISIVLLPFIYLAYLWNSLPDQVPIHWNINGEIDRWGAKQELILIPMLLPLLTYLIFLLVPEIDPKQKIGQMGGKFKKLKLVLVLFMSILAIFIIYAAKSQSLLNVNSVLMLLGVLFAVLGNFFKTIKANYFIGIRTPWTLENETVWRETHVLGGKLWFVGGILIMICGLLFDARMAFPLFMFITLLIAGIPIIYSYLRFRKLKDEEI